MLTERQEAVLEFARNYQSAQNVSPSTREVARKVGCGQQGEAKHLQVLARKGQLEKRADGKWGLSAVQALTNLFEAPVYGWIPAGLSAIPELGAEETVAIEPGFFGARKGRPGHYPGSGAGKYKTGCSGEDRRGGHLPPAAGDGEGVLLHHGRG